MLIYGTKNFFAIISNFNVPFLFILHLVRFFSLILRCLGSLCQSGFGHHLFSSSMHTELTVLTEFLLERALCVFRSCYIYILCIFTCFCVVQHLFAHHSAMNVYTLLTVLQCTLYLRNWCAFLCFVSFAAYLLRPSLYSPLSFVFSLSNTKPMMKTENPPISKIPPPKFKLNEYLDEIERKRIKCVTNDALTFLVIFIRCFFLF